MAHPKRQHSKQRQRKRRTHFKAQAPNMGVCSQCKSPVLSHRVCPSCGYYKDKPVIEIATKEKEKK